MGAKEELKEVWIATARTAYEPMPVKVYKPLKSGDGTALNLRVQVRTSEKGDYLETEGGLFLELVPQVGFKDSNAQFGWDDPKKVTAKLGKADITGLLVGIREWRTGKPVPTYLQPKSPPNGDQIQLFHKFGAGSTVISYTLKDEGASLRVSKGKDHARNMNLSLSDELELVDYLQVALRAYNTTGMR
jgi:hypothetical protein